MKSEDCIANFEELLCKMFLQPIADYASNDIYTFGLDLLHFKNKIQIRYHYHLRMDKVLHDMFHILEVTFVRKDQIWLILALLLYHYKRKYFW